MTEAVILAGGFGTRLRSVVTDMPKPMASVAGRPFLDILLSSLIHKGVTRAVLSVGYMADKIEAYFGTKWKGIEIAYAVEDTPLGTGGGIKRALSFCKDDFALVMNGDTFLDLDIGAVIGQWQVRKIPIIVVRKIAEASRYGCVEVNGAGRVTGFAEKGRVGPGLINAGTYVFPAGILDDAFGEGAFSIETDFLAKVVKNMRFDAFVTEAPFIDIGLPEDYYRAQTELA